MVNRMLLTGASGYLGGTILARLKDANLPKFDLYCLVRNEKQANEVKKYGGIPVELDLKDQEAVNHLILDNKVNIVFFLIDAMKSDAQTKLISALSELKKKTGQEVYFLHTSGAKIFSEFAGHSEPLTDVDADLFERQCSARGAEGVADLMNSARQTNCTIIEEAEKRGVKSIIYIPCIVYGRGSGFGNKISIQTVAVVKAALACKRVYKVDDGHPTWPVSHIDDTADLYLAILRAILKNRDLPHGKKGYYLASSGSVAWDDLYQAMARRLFKKKVIETDQVIRAGETEIVQMAKGVGCPPAFVRLQLGGQCSLEAKNGANVGWKPRYPAHHAIEAAADEVDLILDNLQQM